MRPHLESDWALLPAPSIENGPTVDISGGVATLHNGAITVEATETNEPEEGRCACRLRFLDADGRMMFEEIGRGGSLLLKARDFTSLAGGRYAVEVAFDTDPNEHLHGMGEYQQALTDLKGHAFELSHRNSQASVPFVVSSRGYGFLWNNPAVGRATFGLDRTTWRADATDGIDYWVTAGATPAQIERQYADATGHAPVMPEWGLGFWQCKLRYWNQDQVLEVARGFKERGIPLDLIVIDFFHWPHMGDFRFEKEFWPDPADMCRQLHDMGIKVMVSVWPQVSLDSENYFDMKQRNLLVKARHGVDVGMMFVEPCQFYDATNPEARSYVWNKCRANYADLGIDAFWLDEAEPEWSTYSYENYTYHAGEVETVGNLYPVDYNRGFYEGQLALGSEGDIVNLTRCAWAGAQRYGALVWSGDVGSTFDDLKTQITCAIHMGMAGIPWFTTDMGGFHNGVIDSDEFRELLIRWCQFSTFLPVMRNHGDRSLHDVKGKETIIAADGSSRLQSGADNEPWSYGDEVEGILTKYIRVREMLRPYLRELFRQAHEEGQPLVRGLFYEFPDDEMAQSVGDEYMFGSDLLVAPVVEAGATSREVYLPGGEQVDWVELHTGTRWCGGRVVTADAPLDVVPVFARDGRDCGLAGMV
ncbi:TIM-barrel domain-containing protein [Bifidobacterium lemurum]